MVNPSVNSKIPHVPWEKDPSAINKFLSFVDHSKSPFHAVANLAALLRSASFVHLSERHDWSKLLTPGGRYFFIRNGSSIVAFTIGPSVRTLASNALADAYSSPPSFSVFAAHTDSPCFKVKPVADTTAHGYLQLGVECYGGGLWHTWFDRDLTVAGRVMVRDPTTRTATARLVEVGKPILRIPNLAIHLSRNINAEGFKVNKETDTVPIIATQLAASLNETNHSTSKSTKSTSRYPPLLLRVLAEELNVAPEYIEDVDLCLADTQPSSIGGVLDEFVYAPRLDNLASCYTAIHALLDTVDAPGMNEADAGCIRIVACFDHEEVGSSSSHGADSPLLTDTIRRLASTFDFNMDRALSTSLLISADMAHAIHPNYASKHESNHRPSMGRGLVIKTNQNQRYATSGMSGYLLREMARRAQVAVQEFVVPNDKPCGSTVGPILASRSGLTTVDVGQPMLSMHSVREMCSVHDFPLVLKLFRYILTHFQEIRQSVHDDTEPEPVAAPPPN